MQPRVLVIRGGAIGDFILTLPILDLLRESIPHAHLSVMGNRGIVELAAVKPHVEETLPLDTPGMAMMFAKNARLDPALVERLGSYTLIISYLYDPDGIFRDNLLRTGAKTVLDLPHRIQESAGHATQQLAQPLQRLAMFLEADARPDLKSLNADEARKPSIVIHPGSGSLSKNWPVEHWSACGTALRAQHPESELILLTGEAEAERGITSAMLTAWAPLAFIHWESVTLPELALRLRKCTHFLAMTAV